MIVGLVCVLAIVNFMTTMVVVCSRAKKQRSMRIEAARDLVDLNREYEAEREKAAFERALKEVREQE